MKDNEPRGLRKANMKRTHHHILVCSTVHLRDSPSRWFSEPGAHLPDTGVATSPTGQSAHAPSPDGLATRPNTLDEDALDELAEALRPLPHVV